MERITQKDLENLVDRINVATGNKLEPYDNSGSGCKPNPNVYHLDYAYGGVCLIQMMDKGSGIRSILPGFGTKRELYDKMIAFIDGLNVKALS